MTPLSHPGWLAGSAATVQRARTGLHVGVGLTGEVCAALCAGRRVAVVADAALSTLSRRLARTVRMRSSEVEVREVDAGAVDAETVRRLAADLVASRPDVVIAVGGGTVLDAAAVAGLALERPELLAFALERATQVPVVVLPPGRPDTAPLIAVPTTVGTSAESNAVAVVRSPAGFRLILGERLRPHHAILDAANYVSLGVDALRTGALEALLRLAGARASARADPRMRRPAAALSRELLCAGSAAAPDGLRIARLSAATQRAATLRGRDPFAARHWYLANETAFIGGLTKMSATAAVVASVWQRIEARDSRWGDVAALRTFWTDATDDLRLPMTPSRGIAELLDRWDVERVERPSRAVLAAIGVAAIRTWGDPMPTLGGLSPADLRRVLERGRWAKPLPPAPARETASLRERR